MLAVPDAQLEISPTAKAALWWRQVPSCRNHCLGVIGQLQMANHTEAVALLHRACEQLADQGCTLAVGPMDGATWQSYRCVVESGALEPFLLEPWTPLTWGNYLTAAGFAPWLRYESRRCQDLTWRHPATAMVSDRLRHLGVTLRPLSEIFQNDGDEVWLDRLHNLVMASFRRQPLFQPIDRTSFRELYSPLLPMLQRQWVLLACHSDRWVGFLLAYPASPTRLVLKTLAVLPERAYRGLGRWLVEYCHQRAFQAGFQETIHALMLQGSVSANLSADYGPCFRQYALFARALSEMPF